MGGRQKGGRERDDDDGDEWMIQCRGSVTACPLPLVRQMRGNRVIFHSNNGGEKVVPTSFHHSNSTRLVLRADKSVEVHPVKKCFLIVGEIDKGGSRVVGNVFFEWNSPQREETSRETLDEEREGFSWNSMIFDKGFLRNFCFFAFTRLRDKFIWKASNFIGVSCANNYCMSRSKCN